MATPISPCSRAMDCAPDTHVLIVGNGPAGLSLSAFLSGILPSYNQDQPHPNPLIHDRLVDSDETLLDQDLSWCDSLEGLGGSGRPLSVLYDSLQRPGADIGQKNASSLVWDHDPSRYVPHIVVGDTPVGGSWNDYDPQMLAVSFASWLDLPGYSVSECLGGMPLIPRLPSVVIANYMDCYAKHMGLKRNIRSHTRVTSIKKEGSYWRTQGVNADGRPFSITSRKVVLACGKTKSRTLGLENEAMCKHIVYDVPSMKERIIHDTEIGEEYTAGLGSSRVVVVGDGISSADVIRHCLEKDIPVLHVMRRSDKQLRSVLMSRLSAAHYGEYHTVYRLMTGRDRNPLYEKTTSSSVIDVQQRTIVISTPKGEIEESLGLLAVCIGREGDVSSLLPEGKTSFSGYFCDSDPSLLAVGSFAGDHFVRYLVGGCLEVAREIHSTYHEKNNNSNAVKPRSSLLLPSCYSL